MPSFDIVNRIDLQEVDNAVNITKKTIQTRYDFRESKTEITLDKKDKKITVTTEDEMRMRAVQETLVENLAKRKVDTKCLEVKASEMAAHGMIQKEISIKEGVDSDTARSIVKLIKDQKLKVQAAIQEKQVRVTGKKIDDLQVVIKVLRSSNMPIPLQFINMQN
ncbi:MAG: YajQ family cyclic di-GMP-binding protein [Deltaproteobacteria bacterium]|nr:YajQ family cyclic di-GMP-binding protein [Deltaproteobacteria bacterium]